MWASSVLVLVLLQQQSHPAAAAVEGAAACRPPSQIRTAGQYVNYMQVQEWQVLEEVAISQGRLQLHLPYKLSSFSRRALTADDDLVDSQANSLPVEFVSEEVHCECDVVEETPTFLFSFVMFGHWGHTMFDGVMGLYASIYEAGVPLGNITLYAGFFGGGKGQDIQRNMGPDGRLELGGDWDSLMELLSGRSLLGLRHLLQRSQQQRICFKKLAVGTPTSASHYYTRMPSHAQQGPVFKPQVAAAFGNEIRRLQPVAPFFDTKCAFRVTIIDRKASRVILNAAELVDALEQELRLQKVQNACVDRVPLEELSIYKQISLMHHTQVLLGVDGTGFLNAFFMPPNCSACVLVTPYLQGLLEPGKEDEFRHACEKVPGMFLYQNNTEKGSFEYPPELGPSAERDAFASGTPEELQALVDNPRKHEATRSQNLRFNLTHVTGLVSQAVRALHRKDGCGRTAGLLSS